MGQTWRRLREAIFEVGLWLDTAYNNNGLILASTFPAVSSLSPPPPRSGCPVGAYYYLHLTNEGKKLSAVE